jgi:3-oxoacyl-[acyl-carrier-protein] synthase III
MTSSSIPRLASEVSVSLMGVGSYLPERRVSNDEILEYLHPGSPRRQAPRARMGSSSTWASTSGGWTTSSAGAVTASRAGPMAASSMVTWRSERGAPPSPRRGGPG